jgi:hypothetical protein
MHLQLKREPNFTQPRTIQSERDRAPNPNSSAIVLIVLLASLCSTPRVVEVLLLRNLESGRIFGK